MRKMKTAHPLFFYEKTREIMFEVFNFWLVRVIILLVR
jgi:hypothetical protein